MQYPKKFVIQYRNQTIPVYIVGDIQYCYFVARIPKEGEVHLTLDFEQDRNMKWIEVNGTLTERASEIGKNIVRQMEKDGFKLDTLKSVKLGNTPENINS
jgi:hypothetical protein